MSEHDDKLDQLNKDLHDVAEAVQNMDSTEEVIEKMLPEVNRIIQEQTDLALAEAEKNRPVRRGEWVGVEGFEHQSEGIVESGKFKGKRMSDVKAAGALLNSAIAQGGGDSIKAPSDYMTKLLDPGDAGAGAEWTFTALEDELWDDIFLQNKVVSLLNPFNMPTDPFKIPLRGEVVVRKGGRGQASDAQDPTTADSILTTTKQIVEVNWDYEMDEDSVIAMMPEMRRMITRLAAEYMDKFALNADATAGATGNINSDDAAPATDSYYLSDGTDGIRHYYLVDQTAQSTDIGTTLTDALLRAGIGRLEKYGVNPVTSPLIVPAKVFLISLMGLDNVVTLDKFGLGATVLTGQLASYQGHPVVVTEGILLAEDDGKVSVSGTNDEGQIAIPNTDQWRVGFKRQLLIEVDKDIQKQIWIMVASWRIAIGARDLTATHTAGVHGITFP